MHRSARQTGSRGGSRVPSKRGRRSGVVLLVVVVIVVMLSLAGLSFVSELYIENRAVRVHGDELQLECLVNSGVEALKAACEQSPGRRQAPADRFGNPNLFRGVLVLTGDVDGRQGRFSVISPRSEGGGTGPIRFGVQNESSRLHLGALLQWDQQQKDSGRQALMNLPGMTESIADAILDWIDADATPRQYGAEAAYYSRMRVPYGPRNALPTSLEELLLVRDVTRELLFGEDADANQQIDAGESRSVSPRASAAGAVPWASLLTVFSAERNLDPGGKRRIDLNEKDLASLHKSLARELDQEWANFIVLYRQRGPQTQADDSPQPADRRGSSSRKRSAGGKRSSGRQARSARGQRPQSAAGIKLDLSEPGKVKIASILDLVGVTVTIPGDSDEDEPTVVESPFSDDRQSITEHLPKLLEYATLDPSPVLYGRINVNESPREVLRGIPVIDNALADRIASGGRGRGSQGDAGRRHPTWLLAEGLVDLDEMKALLPYLTAGGDVFRAQVVGYFDDSGPIGRAEVVIDATSSPPRQVYWKDLRLLGPGYSRQTLGGGGPRTMVR